MVIWKDARKGKESPKHLELLLIVNSIFNTVAKIIGWTSKRRSFRRNTFERKLNARLQNSTVALTSTFSEHG